MGQKKDWIYLVNDESDSSFPTINNCILKYYNFSVDDPDPDGYPLPVSNSNSTPSIDNLKYLEDGSLYLYIDLNAADEGSGLESFFEVEFTRLQDDNYRNLSNSSDNKIIFNAYYNQQNASSSSYKKDLDISSLEDGVYNVKIKVSDRSNNITTYPPAEDNIYYYFAIDRDIYIEESDITIDDDPNSDKDLRISWPERKDLTEINIKWKTKNDSNYSNSILIPNPAEASSTTITSIDYATDYDFIIIFKDRQHMKQINTESYTRPQAPAYAGHTTETKKVGIETKMYLHLFLMKTGNETSGRYCVQRNTQTSNYTLFSFGEDTITTINLNLTTLITSIKVGSGSNIIIQSGYKDKYSTQLILQIQRSVTGSNIVLIPQ